jgi:mono/diheme cytochrome c family protein
MKAWRLLAAAIIVVAAVPARADAPVQPQSYSGSADYKTYCASCHGDSAKGDGVNAKMLKKPPADLTLLTKRNENVFPEEKLYKTIDGRQREGVHTGTDMPVWGEVFAKSSASEGAENAAARIRALVNYLKTVQAK